MNLIKLLLPLAMMPILTSCIGDEPNNIAYMTAMGIDKTESGYLYTIQFAQPTKISGGSDEGGGSVGNIVDNITVEAPTIYSAINIADTIISKDLSLSHAKVLVVSEEIAHDGIAWLNDVIARNNDIRPDIYISVTENAGEYLEEVKPSIELNPVKYYQLTYENKNGSAIPQNNAMDFYSSYFAGSRDCLLPLAGIAENADNDTTDNSEKKSIENARQAEAEPNTGGFDNGTRNYYAGETGKRIRNKSEVLGSAVFSGDKYVGKLGSTETELHNILMHQFTTMNLSFYTGLDSPLTLKVFEKTPPKYIINKEEKTTEIYPELQCELLSAPEEYRRDRSTKDAETEVASMVNAAAEDLICKVYKEMGSDMLGIRGRLRKQFLTLDEYMRYCQSFVPSEWSFSVRSQINIRRTGMTYYK
ncbi:MAG: hypothetical protein IJH37_04835 [Clostridia bacterium]|nr:hypothetical protein [Clostridia bacterium]